MDALVLSVLKSYPQIYLACHVDHVRRRSTEHALSSRDSAILSHLSRTRGMAASLLARHLGVLPSTLSAAIARLGALGYAEQAAERVDRRRKRLTLTEKGEVAMASTSVLDPEQVAAVLRRMPREKRAIAVEGLALLAQSARRLSGKKKSTTRKKAGE